jgi:hypothetical protein
VTCTRRSFLALLGLAPAAPLLEKLAPGPDRFYSNEWDATYVPWDDDILIVGADHECYSIPVFLNEETLRPEDFERDHATFIRELRGRELAAWRPQIEAYERPR